MLKHFRKNSLRCAGLALCASAVLAPATASADSIAYVKDYNVWVATPDGSRQHQVTKDGAADWAYGSPSQADDGTIVARKGTDIVRLAQNGTVLSSFDPPDTTDSAGQHIGGTPSAVAVSPDGTKVAYTYHQASCPPGVSCGVRYVTLYSHADRATAVETFGKLYRNSPTWVSNDRILAFGGFGRQVNHDQIGGGDESDLHWFDDSDMFGLDESEDLGDGELSRDGTRLVTIRSYGANTHLMFYKATGTSTLPVYACNTGTEETLDSPTWSPDGTKVAFAHKEGIEVLPLPSVEPDCPGAQSGTVVIPGGSEPDWGPANVDPKPIVNTPGDQTGDQTGGPQTPQPVLSARQKCLAKAGKPARRSCLRKLELKACKAKKTKSARKRCTRKVNRKYRR